MNEERIREEIRKRYGERARSGGSCCPATRSCCSGRDSMSQGLGYSEEQLAAIPKGANLGLGCGNPTALASLRPGETVLDLGCGAGMDCFLAARAVGPSGRAIGIDMTAEMVGQARENARANGIENVDFRLGEIERLPVGNVSVDVVISNCVINLSTDKPRVFREAFRVLRPGGRLAVSDIVLLKPLPEGIASSIEAYVGCIAGASMKADYLCAIEAAGFRDIKVVRETASSTQTASEARLLAEGQEVGPAALQLEPQQLRGLARAMTSISVQARRPGQNEPLG